MAYPLGFTYLLLCFVVVVVIINDNCAKMYILEEINHFCRWIVDLLCCFATFSCFA